MNKRGISQVIFTIIMITLVLIAVGIVWTIIQNILSQETENIELGVLRVDLEIKSVKIESDGSVKVKIGRKVGEGDISGLKFIVSDGSNTETIDKENVDLDQLEEKTFTLTSGELGSVGFVKEISVAPIFTLESGKEKLGDVIDTLKFSNKQIIKNLGGISWWKFDGDASDEIGGNHGTLEGGVSFADGKFGKAGSFDGINDYVEIGNDPSLQFNSADSFTISCWIKTGDGNNDNCVRTQNDTAGSLGLYGLRVNSGKINFLIRDQSGNLISFFGPSIVNDNQWHYIAGVRDIANDKLIIYADGIQDNETTDTTTGSLDSHRVIHIGSYKGVAEFFNGTIDEVMIFNKALSDKEVKALYGFDFN